MELDSSNRQEQDRIAKTTSMMETIARNKKSTNAKAAADCLDKLNTKN